LVLLMVPALLVWGYLQGGSPSFLGIRTYQSNAAAGRGRGVSATRRPSGVVIRRVGRLPGAVQDAAVAALRFKTEVLWAQLDAIERGDTQPEAAV
jgi:hypothetical protein